MCKKKLSNFCGKFFYSRTYDSKIIDIRISFPERKIEGRGQNGVDSLFWGEDVLLHNRQAGRFSLADMLFPLVNINRTH